MNRLDVEDLYRTYGSLVKRRAQGILRDEQEALDVMQEVFVRVVKNIEAFRKDASPATWLYRITTNLCLNRIRDGKRRQDKHEHFGLEAPTKVGAGHTERLAIIRMLERVPPKLAQPALYYFLDGLSHREVAELLGLPRRTVTNRIKKFEEMAKHYLPSDGARHSG